MRLHEYQSRALLAAAGVPVPKGEVAENSQQALAIAKTMGGNVVVKAQVLMGGRGKAGGVKLFDSAQDAADFTQQLIGKRLSSVQNPAGIVVEKVLVSEKIAIDQEYYLAILLDRAKQSDVVMISARGGVDIEQVAAETPDAIVKCYINPKWGVCDFELRRAIKQAGIDSKAVNQMVSMIKKLVLAYQQNDATLIEINPCVLTPDGKLIAADAKVTIDDNALFRHADLAAAAEQTAEDPIEAEAAKKGIAYVKLDGEIGVIGNGAGLVMLTLDEVARAGKKAANFLDVGGGAQAERVRECVDLVLKNPNVRVLLINIFGGITRGDEVAKGVVQAIGELNVTLPIVVRVEGTNAQEAQNILSSANLITADSVQQAAEKAAALAG
jgi:succinyl-CoA synthetase beta subunit